MEKHISFLEPKEKELEKKVLSEYSSDEVWRHLEYLTTLIRRAGTEDELKAAEYIKGKLEEYGVDAEIYEFDGYISYPGEAELESLSPVQKSFPCLPRTFIASTPPDGIEAELISIGKGEEEDYRGVDPRGKIVLVKPPSIEGRIEVTRIAQEHGAIAQIHMTGGKSREINMGQVRYTWGNPTPETVDKVPTIPVISICKEDGEFLIELSKKNRIVMRLRADTWCGYKKIHLPVGTLEGMKEPEKYVLLGGHYCSWYAGATDNAVANSLMLEMARIFSKYRKSLDRGVKFAWWSGHEQGTYAGSTWYLDNFWDNIRDNTIAYVNMDGLGRAGTSVFQPKNTEEIRKFHEIIVKKVLGLEVKSNIVSKIGDQSFWGIGLPSATGRTEGRVQDLSDIKPQSATGRTAYMVEKLKAVEETQHVTYSHTVEDTLDKVDMEVVAIPFKINSVLILRLCNSLVLPFEFVSVAEAFKKGLNDLENINKSVVDLTSLINQVEELERKAKELNEIIKKNLLVFEKKKPDKKLQNKFKEINICLMELSRILIPVLYSKAGKYGQDPMGTKFRPLPTLHLLERLISMDSESEEYKALYTSLLRERNRISDTLNSANHILDNTLNTLD